MENNFSTDLTLNDSGANTEVHVGNPLTLHLSTIYVIAVVILGSVGNSLTAYTILSVPSLRTTSNILVASLALTDILTVLISIPVLYSRMRFGEFYKEHDALCRASYHALVIFILVSVNHLQVIAANRYFIITRPRHVYNKYWGRLGTGVILAVVWGYCATLTFLPFLGFGEIKYIPELGGCGIVETNTLSWWYKTFLLMTVVESCGVATPLFFALTFKKIRDVKRRVQTGNSNATGNPAAMVTGRRAKTGGLSRQERAVTRMTVSAFLCFICCWSPYLILHVVTIGGQKSGVVASFFLVFAFSSSVFNPIIYAGMNRNFRRALCVTKGRHSEASGNTVSVVTSPGN